MEITLDKSNRQQEVNIPENAKKLKFEVSRTDCRDVLVEFIDVKGVARSKPLSKCTEEIKLTNIIKIRFIMNEMSVKPIEIRINI